MLWIATVVGSLILAEFYGYCLHVLLHSYAIPALSRAHMNHHINSYPPGGKQRSEEYIQEVNGDILVLGLGLEWLIPSAVLIFVTVGLEWLIGLSWAQIAVSLSIILLYSFFLFWVLHDALHLNDAAPLKSKLLRKWFIQTRKLHDIHHHYVDDAGLMNRNYGIAFFVFDRLFGTFLPILKGGINERGLASAHERLKKS